MDIDTGFGWIIIDGKRYSEDIIILPDGTIMSRRKDLSEAKRGVYGHTPLSVEEMDWLLATMGSINYLIIGNGQYGSMPIEEEALKKAKDAGIVVIVDKTPKAIKKYIDLKDKGFRVGALFHITC